MKIKADFIYLIIIVFLIGLLIIGHKNTNDWPFSESYFVIIVHTQWFVCAVTSILALHCMGIMGGKDVINLLFTLNAKWLNAP